MAQAIEVFVRGYCFVRSFTHPCIPHRIDNQWVTRDAERTGGNSRREEWSIHGITATQADRLVRLKAEGSFALCVMRGVQEVDPRDDYKALGYRLGNTEPLMAHRLDRIPNARSPATIQRVRSAAMADRLARVARSRMILREHLGPDPPMRAYVALIDGEIVGWCRSVVLGKASYCAFMYVKEPFRRRGIARSLMCKMLRDDRAGGATIAVLLASHTGAKLYDAIGYEQLGTLFLFTPPR